jgi:uncharacterized protein YyaL (SSP411 family)
VDWYPWGDEAFATAGERDIPVILSVGYSACHWCHVMAHESFEDEAVARAMNSGFVNVKVDREERPDVDAVYMEAVQAITGSGGWPMTVFLLPDGRPFHGGTYFPRDTFTALLARVGELWHSQRAQLVGAAEQVSEAVRRGTDLPSRTWASSGDPAAGRSPALLAVAGDSLLARVDPDWGGFGMAPKFPQPAVLETLLLAACSTGRSDLMGALTRTLDAMAAGGIYDHLGGGFARYSTDRQWLVPHFEKMLYDNALLAKLYLHAWQATGARCYLGIVEETFGYLLAPPVRLPGAGFASAEDADSEGAEGRFYVWDLAEVLEVAGPETAAWYGVTDLGNWEGHNILRRPLQPPAPRPPAVERGRQALLDRRSKRPRPGLDGKVLTEWNAMAVSALAEGAAAAGRPDWLAESRAVAHFMLESMRSDDGRWLRSWQGGTARHLAYAADLAWVVDAFTRLAEASGDAGWVSHATNAAQQLLDLFWDPGIGAFRTIGSDAEALLASPVDTQDGAIPSANSVAVSALLRLGALTGRETFSAVSRTVIEAMGPALGAAPSAFASMVGAAHLAVEGPAEVVVSGDRSDLVEVVQRAYLPMAVLAWGEPYDSPLWHGRSEAEGLAHVCQGYTCRAPTGDVSELERQLAWGATSAASTIEAEP